MKIDIGARLGPYEVISRAGAGGMGEVWQARDTRLDRSVAIKVLPNEFAHNAQLRLRFEREAKSISQLNHPHICTLYDVGQHEGVEYLVMEYLDGETLADRIAKGPLPLADVLRIGMQIAEALDRAHKAGIVHRDLKPGNVMLTRGGAKLLDFGLAKSDSSPNAQPLFSTFPTAAHTTGKPLTEEGTIVGTFQYMAPEQLEGGPADARTDIFALGTLLYEMATGKRAFDGKTRTSLVAAIIERDPVPMSSVQPLTPPAFERLVKTCLAKDPDDRWQTAHDVLLQLRWIDEAGSQAGVAAPVTMRRKTRERFAWAAVALLLAASGTFAALWYRIASTPPRRATLSVLPPSGGEFIFYAGAPLVSPDGSRLAYSARGADGKVMLYVRRLDDGSIVPLAATENSFAPFWSADSKFVAFFFAGKLRKIDASGGPAQIICDARAGRGGTWNAAGDIVFSPSDRDPLFRVSAAGGTPVAVTALDPKSEYSHRWPSFLPDGKHFLYVAQTFGSAERGRVLVGSIDGKERKQILGVNSPAVYADGRLLYVRDDTLLAQKFDLKRLETSGDPVVVAESIYGFRVNATEAFSASPAGILAYFQGSGPGIPSRITWRDRDGKQLSSLANAGEYQQPQLSHDERRIAYALWDKEGSDVWIYDIARQVPTRFTFGPGLNTNAVWSPDDKFLVYATEDLQRGMRTMMRKPASGVGAPEPLFVSSTSFLGITDWTADGKYVIVHFADPKTKTGADVYAYSIPEKRVMPVVQTPASECCGRVSPDVRWIAYSSNETGKTEVYVQPFPVATGRWQISTGGGTQARWSADGKQIFYSGVDNRIYAVDVRATDATFEPGVPKPLFAIRPKPGGWPFDVTRDGKFVINEAVDNQAVAPVTVIVNWSANLPK